MLIHVVQCSDLIEGGVVDEGKYEVPVAGKDLNAALQAILQGLSTYLTQKGGVELSETPILKKMIVTYPGISGTVELRFDAG